MTTQIPGSFPPMCETWMEFLASLDVVGIWERNRWVVCLSSLKKKSEARRGGASG